MSWKEEDEYIDEESNTGFGEKKSSDGFPVPVAQRMVAYAERTGKNIEEVKQMYTDYIKKEYGVEDWTQEDVDILIDWAEQAFVQTRKQTASTSGTSTWVGCFIGVADRTKDRLTNIVSANVKLFKENPAEAIGTGRVGVYEKDGGLWSVRNKDGLQPLDESADNEPQHGIKVGDEYICLLTRKGIPSPSTRMGRYAYFLGGEEGDFVKNSNITVWKVDLTDDNITMNLDIGRPCKIPVIPPREDANDFFKTVLGTYSNFEINYSDDFVPEEVRPLLQPVSYWTNEEFHDLYVRLDDIEDVFESKKEKTNIGGRSVTYGPLIITKGTINSMNTEPRDSEYDPEGFNYFMSLSSMNGDVDCWIPGAVGIMTNPFQAHWGEQAFDYAENSTVFVFGRLGMKDRDGLMSPKITVMGIYGHPRRCRKRASGGNTGVGQFE
jgi:hypothetical protein